MKNAHFMLRQLSVLLLTIGCMTGIVAKAQAESTSQAIEQPSIQTKDDFLVKNCGPSPAAGAEFLRRRFAEIQKMRPQ
jgi:hypothetical protein